MFKISTLKGRKWFYAYISLITITLVVLLLFGSLFATITAEEAKRFYIETHDVDSFENVLAWNDADEFIHGTFSVEHFAMCLEFIDELKELQEEYHLTVYSTFSFSYDSKPLAMELVKNAEISLSSYIFFVSPEVLHWMFPDDNETETKIYIDEDVSERTHIRRDDEITITIGNITHSSVVGKTFTSPYYFFKDRFHNTTVVSSTLIPTFFDSLQEYDLTFDIYLDIDSAYLSNFKTNKLIKWLEDLNSRISYLFEELLDETSTHVKHTYHSPYTLHYIDKAYENAVYNYSTIELVLFPSYLMLGVALWALLKEGFVNLTRELHLYVTRGAQKPQFVKHYATIFVVSDISIVLLFAGIGELVSQLTFQISSFTMSFIGGVLTLIPLELLKIYFLHRFSSTYVETFSQVQTTQTIKKNHKDLSFRQMIILLGLGLFFVVYSIALPLIVPSDFISLFILISRIIAGVLVLIAATLFSLRISLNTSTNLLSKLSKETKAITTFISRLFASKRRNFKLFTLVSFWLILASSFTLNTIELNRKSERLHDQVNSLDVELYTKGNFLNLSDVFSVLSDEDVKTYIPIAKGWELWDNYEEVYFLPLLNITDACPSFYRLENARGKPFDFQTMVASNNSLLVSHNVIERKGYELEDNISLNVRFSTFDPDNPDKYKFPETFLMANYTIFDEFDNFPFLPHYKWSEDIDPQTFKYIADYSVLERWFGEVIFTNILIDLKKNVDPLQWGQRIREKWGVLEDYVELDIPDGKNRSIIFRDDPNFERIAIMEVFILSAVTIGFTLFYFQSLIRHSKTQIFIALARGMNRKQLQRGLIWNTACLLLINITLSFLVGISFSAIFHFGLRSLELRIFKLIPITFSVVIFFVVILGVSIISALISYMLVKKQIDTAAISQMGATILGE